MAHVKNANLIKMNSIPASLIEVVEGSLLGDGSLTSSGKQYRLRIEHTLRQSEYVLWKYDLLHTLVITRPQVVGDFRSLRFGTVGHPDLSLLRQKWYPANIKTVPIDFQLTPLMLAIWFMDDGCKQGNSVDLSVHNFSESCIAILRASLKSLDVESTVIFDGKGNRIYVRRRSFAKFEALVKPYVLKCMAYKLP